MKIKSRDRLTEHSFMSPLERSGRLKGKVAIVTGSAREHGIGRGIAEALAIEGANVVVNGVSKPEMVEQRAEELRQLGVESIAYIADVSNREHVDSMINATVERFGRLDILVSNAAVMWRESFLETQQESVDFTLRVNLLGTFNMCQAAARQMIDQGEGGSIIVVSSVHAVMPFAVSAVYGSTKHAMLSFTNQIAIELAQYGIRVNNIGPGWVPTDMGALPADQATAAGLEDRLKQIPLGEPVTPYDCGRGAVYYATADGSRVTGTFLRLDAGQVVSKY